MRARWLVVALPVLLSVLLRLPFLSAPFERDEGEYAYIAWRMSEGDVPYRDAFDQKPPGVFGVYWLAFALFGRSVEAVRLVLTLWGVAATAAAALLGRRYGGPRAGLAAGVAFAMMTTAPGFWATAANTELFMLLPLLGALALAFPVAESGVTTRPGRLAGVGALLAVAVLFKQVAAFFALALLPFLVVSRRRGGGLRNGPTGRSDQDAALQGVPATRGDRRVVIPSSPPAGAVPEGRTSWPPLRLRWKPLAAVVAGGLAVLVPVSLVFAAAGAFVPYLDAVLLHNLLYAGSECQSWSLPFLGYILGRIVTAFWPVLVLALAGTLVAARWRRAEPRPGWGLILLWLPAALASAALGCRFFPHYFLAAAPPLALLAGLGVEGLAGWVERRAAARGAGDGGSRTAREAQGGGRRTGDLATALALVAVFAVPMAREADLFLTMGPGARSHAIYGPEIFPGAQALGEYLRTRTAPGEAVFVLGSEPQVLFHAERRSATRYIFLDPLLGSFPDAAARQQEAIEEVRRARPAAVVFVRHPNSLGAPPDDDIPLIRSTRDLLARGGYGLEGAMFLVPEGTALALGPGQVAALRPGALRRATVLVYLRPRP